MKTCSDPEGRKCRNEDLSKQPDGCVCPEGMLMSGRKCVDPDQCGCTYRGQYVEVGVSSRMHEALAQCWADVGPAS